MKKCEFCNNKIKFLGYEIGENGIESDPDKIEKIKNVPIPRNIKDIRSFLGLTGYYRRFIKDFTQVAKQMTKLLRKKNEFKWRNKQ